MAAPALLDIYVLSLSTRVHYYNRLVENLVPMINAVNPAKGRKLVDLHTLVDNGECSIGAKRAACVTGCKSQYITFIDDDDMVSANYLSAILEALKLEPDAVGYWAEWWKYQGEWQLSALVKYCLPEGGPDHPKDDPNLKPVTINGLTRQSKHWFRFPGQLCPIKSDIAKQINYNPEIQYGEDWDFANRLKASGLIKNQQFIDNVLYHYLYRSPPQREGEINHDIYQKNYNEVFDEWASPSEMRTVTA